MLTLAGLEAEVIRPALFGEVLALVGLDGTTRNGSNQGIRAALRSALRDAGVRVSDPLVIVDADVESLTGNLLELVLCSARVNLLREILLGWHRAENSQDADIEACKRMEERLRRLLREYDGDLKDLRANATSGGAAGVTVGLIKAGRRLPKYPPRKDVQ